MAAMTNRPYRDRVIANAERLAILAKMRAWKVGDLDAYRVQLLDLANLKADLADDFGVLPAKWSGRHLVRILAMSGANQEHVAEALAILARLGLGSMPTLYPKYPTLNSVFDHGEMWRRGRHPWAIIGHPYPCAVHDEERNLLASLKDLGVLHVGVDDRPSYYGHGTHHIRISLMPGR